MRVMIVRNNLQNGLRPIISEVSSFVGLGNPLPKQPH